MLASRLLTSLRMSLPAFSSIAGNPAVHHTILTKEQKLL